MDSSASGTRGPLSGAFGLSGFSLKQLISWGPQLNVDHPQIDAQHQGIFDIATEIAEIWHQRGDLVRLKTVAGKLAKVLDAHFRYEEQELADINYTKLEEHRAEHKMMLADLQRIRDRLDQMTGSEIRSEPGFMVLSFVLGVTVGHISHSDMDYRAFAHRESTSGTPPWPGK